MSQSEKITNHKLEIRNTTPSIVWFRRDLRLHDNPALNAAITRGQPIVCLYINAPDEQAPWQPGAASRWWLDRSLRSLDQSLRQHHNQLIIRLGPSLDTLQQLIQQTGATHVYWNRCYEPALIKRDTRIKKNLRDRHHIAIQTFNATLLHEPGDILSQAGEPLRVYTPFWKSCQRFGTPREPQSIAGPMAKPQSFPPSLSIDQLNLRPTIHWDAGLHDHWQVGEQAAQKRLETFLTGAINQYDTDRDRPAIDGTSQMSPHLHFGEISPQQIWHAIGQQCQHEHADKFLRELVWREFSAHLLFHFPSLPTKPMQPKFAKFPWKNDKKSLQRWQQGRTGYPIIDAGMRQLWATGWMHNRVRMIVASFLVKNLLIHWKHGARWFWDTLVDADLANNTQGWQWTAGCGADAAPYFRIFNPITQSARFDPTGDYLRQWLPELAQLDDKNIHAPWESLQAHPLDYPDPMIDLKETRQRALDAFAKIK